MLRLIKKRFFINAEKFMLFLFFSLFFTFLLYLTGIFQYFLDSTQIMLIRGTYIISLILLVCSVYYGGIIMLTNLGKRIAKAKRIRKYIFFISLLVFSTIILLISQFILVWATN